MVTSQILAAKQQHISLSPFDKGESFVAYTSALERQIDPVRFLLSNGVDQMVYNLYDLTPEEIAIMEGRE